ncbi:MAG: SusC/RagA family TonB-linked outer membrane protein [Flammeovirgaceae bacterium]|nr:SusC/RagA family TonB-linked outer membrane protein [Flammeovirgaceae bacterium]MBE61805.1 SusC/RagA family TonB-linked outer membrane protein [Flammeovirgaceae bacterium]HCX24257.1 SusC/RagA family TonB-linked outer membrane protein [Cytophagales bacterium]
MGLLKIIQFKHLMVIGLLMSSVFALAQGRVVTGNVTDAGDGTTLPGATVLEKGTSNGTITDIDGNYSLTISGDDAILIVSFVGFETKEIAVGSQSIINASLGLSLSELSEVVVIGYGTQQKKVATGAISKVDAKSLEGYKVANVQSALDGQISGVIVGESSGQPGSSKSILIHGIGTNGDNSPLFIVDGLTVSGIDNLNPSDIESVDVLKDAASTAIYGARAANGVIIITTKKGVDGKGQITYEGFTAVSNPWKLPEMLNSEQYIELTREKFANSGQSNNLNALGFPNVGDETANTSWMDQIFNQSTQVNHRLSATLNNAYMSLEYWDQNGVIGGEKSNYKRYAIRLNSTKEINDYVTVGENLYLNRTENQNIGTNNAFGTVIVDAFAYDPLTEVYDADAEYGFAQSRWVQKEYVNPLSRLFLANNKGHADQVQGNVYLKIKPIDGLTLNSDLGIDFSWYDYRSFTPDYFYHSSFFSVNNSVSQGYGFGQTLQFENYANYQKDFGQHSINAVVGTTYLGREFRSSGGSTLNIPDAAKFNEQFHYIDAGQDTSDLAYGYASVDSRLISYYGRIIYDYQDKYLFSATIRKDGSSKFGANNRWGFFPSLSLGWVISDEIFFPSNFISFAKIRGSWGVNGNDRIGDLGYSSQVVNAFTYALGSTQALNRGSALATVPNPNLKWEESVQFDLGLELKFMDDQLSTEIDYFVKSTKDLLGTEQVPGYLGVTDFPLSNLGEIQNKGIDASISYRQSIGKVNFSTKLNYTTFKNEVIEVPGTSTYLNGWSWPVRNQVITRMSEGQPVGHFVGYKTLGIFQSDRDVFTHLNRDGDPLQPNAKPGDLIFADVNGDGVINSDDITNIGSPWPDHIIGLNISANWNGFDFSALLSTQIGQDVYRTYERSDITFTNYQTFWLDRWTEEKPSSDLPRLVSNDPNGNQRPSDFYVEDGSFLRLRNVQFGYNLPSSILEKVKLSGVRIYFTANNIFTLTGYRGFDPEIGTDGWILNTGIDKGYYPSNKTFGGGLKISM